MKLEKVFVNRTLNMRKIKYIGFDMDHTLVRYNTQAFEELAHRTMLKKLVEQKNYPEAVLQIKFDFNLAIRGLIIDRKKGNLLKVSRHSAIRASYHGTKPIDFATQQKLYKSIYIDLSETQNYIAIDTAFSISVATLYAQLVELKDEKFEEELPNYDGIATDVMSVLDQAHADGSLKSVVKSELSKFIVKDPASVEGLERYVKHGKKLFLLTNSDYGYTKLLLDYAINPFLKEHKTWLDLFEIIVTNSSKPRFFLETTKFLQIDPLNGLMTNYDGKLGKGVFQGGHAMKFTSDLDLEGDDILYIGDHIYGDILRLKKSVNWRTALVVEELELELERAKKADPYFAEIRTLMDQKEPLELELVNIISTKIETGKEADDSRVSYLQNTITDLDKKISHLIRNQQSMFNPHWGEVFRAGNEESYFAHQVDRFACIYMAKVADLLELSPRMYFRAGRRPLAHELALNLS